MLYNYPGRMSVSMGEEFFDAVADVKNIVAIKESSGDMAQLHRLAIHRPNIQLSCGWDDQALEFFAWGARAGSAPAPTSFRVSTWPCTRPA